MSQYAIFSCPQRKTVQARDDLSRLRVAHRVPTYIEHRRLPRQRTTIKKEVAVIPGVVFIEVVGHPGDQAANLRMLSDIGQLPRIRPLFMNGKPMLTDDGELDRIAIPSGNGKQPKFNGGELVSILGGPFEGMDSIVLYQNNDGTVALSFLANGLKIKISPFLIRKNAL